MPYGNPQSNDSNASRKNYSVIVSKRKDGLDFFFIKLNILTSQYKITECHGANPGMYVYIHNLVLSYFRITMVHSNAVVA